MVIADFFTARTLMEVLSQSFFVLSRIPRQFCKKCIEEFMSYKTHF